MTRAYIGLGILILFEILILFMGCQNGGMDPTIPDDNPPSDILLSDTNLESTSRTAASIPSMWGLYEFSYNSHTRELSSVPLRGPAFAWNIVKFLQPPAGSLSGVTIGVLDDSAFFSDGLMDIRVILHHPFPGQPQYTGFDVAGVLITEGSLQSNVNSNLTYADTDNDPSMRNPDGYTRWMNPTEFLSGDVFGFENGAFGTSESSENSGFLAGATLNPYKYYAHGLGPNEELHEWISDSDSIENRGMFPSGGTCSRDYELLFPIVDDEIVFVFNYAVLAHWAPPEADPVEDPLTDFPPEANCGQPLHIFATDNSTAYYTWQDAGGNVTVDLEIFDWDALNNPDGVPGEVSKFVLWSDGPLIDGGWAEILSTEVEWNSGYVASTSVVTLDVPADPDYSGNIPLWIEIQSANPTSYDQGFDKDVPDDPLASYMTLPINVKDCPKAGAGEVDSNGFGTDEELDDIVITGENFVQGNELGVWLEQIIADGEAGTTEPHIIVATDVKYVDENTITADFNLSGAEYGDYGMGCTNGCGTVTLPTENTKLSPLKKLRVVAPRVLGVQMATNRSVSDPETLDNIELSWTGITKSVLYRVYANVYDLNGQLISEDVQIGSTTQNQFDVNISQMQLGANGIYEFWMTRIPTIKQFDYNWESKESKHVWVYLQGFENGMGNWQISSESDCCWRWARSSVNCSYSGDWGIKTYGYPIYDLWTVFASPLIPDLSTANHVSFEFVHRHMDINEDNGYLAGWAYDMPANGASTFPGFNSFTSVLSGYPYNDPTSLAIQTQFGLSNTEDNNWETNDDNWQGWWFSKFNASEILNDTESERLMVGAASKGYYTDYMEINVDDIAILVY